MSDITITVEVDNQQLQNNLVNVLADNATRLQIHNLFAKLINPWVPFVEGLLAQNLEITPDYVRYAQPYAHYHYIGQIYGPNFPGWEDSGTPGWRSPSGKGSKHPTGRKLGEPGTATLTPRWQLDENGNYVNADPSNLIEWEFGRDLSKHPLATDHWDKYAMQTQIHLLEQGVKDIILRRMREMYGG